MPSRWPAVGAETDPLRRARQLRKSWERLVADGALGPELAPGAAAALRPTIVDSWRRSLAAGLDPTDVLAPIEADESEVLERWFDHPLGSLAQDLMERLRLVAEESQSMVVVTDASGLVLHRMGGDERLKERAAEMNLVEGARYSEAADGTNGIGTALAADRAFQVFAFEHFNERHHEWVCSGAPVHDPVSGRVVGVVDLSSLWKTTHLRSLELANSAARTIERHLLEVRRDQDARLRRRYCDLMTRSTDLLVSRDGYVLAGAQQAHAKPLDIPEGGGEVVLSDGTVGVAVSIGQGEAYLLRDVTVRHPRSAPVEVLERAEQHVRELVTEQAALRQVATLVARESSPDQLFAAVTDQVARVFDVPIVTLVRYESEGWVVVGGFSDDESEPFPIGFASVDYPGVIATVRQTGRPARVEDYAHVTGEIAAAVRAAGIHSTVASPITVEGRLWGAMVVSSRRQEPFPEATEARLTDFTELVATAIANAESRKALALLADEQAALRSLAVLVAQQPSPGDVFAAVTQAVGPLLDADLAVLHVFDGDGKSTAIASWSGDGPILPIGTRFPLDGDNLAARIFASGATARLYSDDEAWKRAQTDLAGTLGMRSAVGAPILVEGKLWGALMAASRGVERWAENAETRIAAFTELVATAIANAESRGALAELADEQAALRRVATLVARGAPAAEVFDAVATEVGKLFDTDITVVGRYNGDGTATAIGNWSASGRGVPLGTRSAIGGHNVLTIVSETGKPARVDGYDDASGEAAEIARRYGWRSSIAAPIAVEGRVWGVMLVATERPELFPSGSEKRLAAFTDLVATAVGNAQARAEVERLADEQAALRRVATLVARGTEPATLFGAVCDEAQALLGSDIAGILRFHDDRTVTVTATSGKPEQHSVGTRVSFDSGFVVDWVHETHQVARFDTDDPAAEDMPEVVRILGVRSAVGGPIVVDGELWGVIVLACVDHPLPSGMERRLADFTELVATAIANAEGKSALNASRRRIVAASDETRRRIERDLHDGTQQRLVSLGLAVRAAEASLPPERDDLRAQLSGVATGLVAAVEDLQEISRGIHPAILSRGGLGPALQALAHRSAIPVDLDITTDVRLEEPTEVAAYFVASEALANAAKHSQASRIDVSLEQRERTLFLSVRDDGVGGADAARGSGLVGLMDRVEALGGSIRLSSRPGEGTQVTAELPLELELPQPLG